MPRWLPDKFDDVAHNLRVAMMREDEKRRAETLRQNLQTIGQYAASHSGTPEAIRSVIQPLRAKADSVSPTPGTTNQRNKAPGLRSQDVTAALAGKCADVAASSAPPHGTAGAVSPGTPAAPLVLPWPPSGNTATRHTTTGHHYLRPEVKDYRNHVDLLAKAAKSPKVTGRYILHLHMSPPDKRTRDADNAWKSVGDALTFAGLIPDDSMTYMKECHITTDDARRGAVIVRIEPYDDPRSAA